MIPEGFIVPARGFLLIWADGQPEQNSPGRDLHVNFRLDRAGEEIGLFTPNGRQVDAVVFGAQSRDVSQGRYPDGAPEPFVFMSNPTPGSSNAPAGSGQIQILGTSLSSDGSLLLTWNSEEGRTYQVQYKDDLNEAAWKNAGSVIATGTLSTSSQELIPGVALRFYRVVQLE
jgi:hypothetical protein